jgi:ABC-2 type transport system permease protein
MTGLLRSEIFRLSGRGMPRILLLILVAGIVGLYLLLWVAVQATEQQPNGTTANVDELRNSLRVVAVRDTGLTMVAQVGSVLVVILAASIIATEFGWGTIRTIVPRSPGRGAFLTAKLITVALFLVLVVVLGWLAALLGSAIVTAIGNLDTGMGNQFLGRTLASIGRTAYTIVPYAALSFALALLARSTAAGVGIGLAVLFLEGLITSLISGAGGPLERVPWFLLSANVQAVIAPNAEDIPGTVTRTTVTDLPNIWQAAAVLAAYTAVFVGVAYWRFRARDIQVD